jgi:hypothetical protein
MNSCECNSISLLSNKDLVLDGVVLPINKKKCGCENSIVNSLTLLPNNSIINTEKEIF